ncbi:DeoR/GlpR family DNA-binding transcription regulator [Tropicimonas sp. TH_r6]|uniref:DeoR/GlpR family DNA-binding transcription regulator n=1 Tax=Tropicimonas sp. TH_r6 TaxID=3082085 RepID=UPI002954F4BF|nr:DeoR/GlpR family DNA-binding transcription regulator [Tropicimonas sp. TH_r6]MDV7145429.1 DeoR/GlpR family DNA-binding transcription regulator [Tropicimonas sp. TH_r6]
MSGNDRLQAILDLLREEDSVETEDLARRFEVTPQTIRRDMAVLVERGLAQRTHGGARRKASTSTIAYEDRRLKHAREKEVIGRVVADMIPNGRSIMLNIGSTTEQVAQALRDHEDLVVMTNNINVVHILRMSRIASLKIAGGSVRPSDGAIIGGDAVAFMDKHKADFAVIGCSSLDADGAILDFDEREVSVARAILRNARKRILVADRSKFDVDASVRICSLEELDVVVTDGQPPESFLQAASACGTRVVCANSSEQLSRQ